MNEMNKCCADCKTTKTPLWRVGPAGPESLCNACGIRYRKKRSAVLGLYKGSEKRREKPVSTITNTSSCGSGKGGNLSEDLRVKLMDLEKEMVRLQTQRSPMKRQKTNSRNLGEEEQAAFLLMALSCGSVFA